jgi:hypothetical protein
VISDTADWLLSNKEVKVIPEVFIGANDLLQMVSL